MNKIQVGDKVIHNGKESVVRDVGNIGGQKVVWLRGETGWIYESEVELSAKLVEQQEYIAAKIEGGKITKLNVPSAKIENGKVIEMTV